MNKRRLVLISGRIDSGKTFLANRMKEVLLEKENCAVLRYGYGIGVKEVARSCFGWDGKKDERGRKLLQRVGTEVGRAYDPDIWVEKAYERIMELIFYMYSKEDLWVIIDDWRFENEYTYFEEAGDFDEIIKVRVTRPEEKISDHISECSLPTEDSFYDFRVLMGGTKDKVRQVAGKLINLIEKGSRL